MTHTLNELKRQAAERAVEAVQSGMVVGLGTGSTAVHAVRAIGRKLADGSLRNIVAIPTSEATRIEAEAHAVPLTTFDTHPVLDLAIDGADEITPELNLIKGLGGALLREKVVETASKQFIVVGDYTKRVDKLGTKAPVPVEIVPFAQAIAARHLTALGGRPVLRLVNDQPFVTDNHNLILDCWFDDGIANPAELAAAIHSQPGIVEHGMFLNLATAAIVATPDGLVEWSR